MSSRSGRGLLPSCCISGMKEEADTDMCSHACSCAAMLMSADAHHIMAPPPEGSGAALAMRNALRDGGLAPADVAYVNAHGTGTPLGDVAKLRAIASAFGGAACAKSAGASSSRNAEAKNGSGRVCTALHFCTSALVRCFCMQCQGQRWCMEQGQMDRLICASHRMHAGCRQHCAGRPGQMKMHPNGRCTFHA